MTRTNKETAATRPIGADLDALAQLVAQGRPHPLGTKGEMTDATNLNRKLAPFQAGGPVFLFVGRYTAVKRLPLLISAHARAVELLGRPAPLAAIRNAGRGPTRADREPPILLGGDRSALRLPVRGATRLRSQGAGCAGAARLSGGAHAVRVEESLADFAALAEVLDTRVV